MKKLLVLILLLLPTVSIATDLVYLDVLGAVIDRDRVAYAELRDGSSIYVYFMDAGREETSWFHPRKKATKEQLLEVLKKLGKESS